VWSNRRKLGKVGNKGKLDEKLPDFEWLSRPKLRYHEDASAVIFQRRLISFDFRQT
jgi:hypothetical protein